MPFRQIHELSGVQSRLPMSTAAGQSKLPALADTSVWVRPDGIRSRPRSASRECGRWTNAFRVAERGDYDSLASPGRTRVPAFVVARSLRSYLQTRLCGCSRPLGPLVHCPRLTTEKRGIHQAHRAADSKPPSVAGKRCGYLPVRFRQIPVCRSSPGDPSYA